MGEQMHSLQWLNLELPLLGQVPLQHGLYLHTSAVQLKIAAGPIGICAGTDWTSSHMTWSDHRTSLRTRHHRLTNEACV